VTELGGEECALRTTPASTFKIPNALIGLDTGVLRDEHQRYAWDGTPKPFEAWQRDHDLTSAFRYSVVWYFQRVAREVGAARYKEALSRFAYGNQDVSGDVTAFWLNDTLTISPREQRVFLEKLFADTLPASPRARALTRQLMETGGDARADLRDRLPFLDELPPEVHLRGKTGTAAHEGAGGELMAVGWFVGAVEVNGRTHVFAYRVRSDDDEKGGAYAAKSAYRRLQERGVIPR
jgi:beta-lactamase class D